MKPAMIAIAAALAAGVSMSTAHAALFVESENNSTISLADPVGTYGAPGDAVLLQGHMTAGIFLPLPSIPGDVDWFTFTTTTAMNFEASIYNLTPGLPFPPGAEILLYNASHVMVAGSSEYGNSNGGSPFMATIAPVAIGPGTYFFAVAGGDDVFSPAPGVTELPDGWIGANVGGIPTDDDYNYQVLIGLTPVPAPSAAGVLGLGLIAAGRRRR